MKILRIVLSDYEIWVDEDNQEVMEADHTANAQRVAQYMGAKIRTVEPVDMPEEDIWNLPYTAGADLLDMFKEA